MDSQSQSVNGGTVSGTSLVFQSASSSSGGAGVGLVNTVAQPFLGVKTFVSSPIIAPLVGASIVQTNSTGQLTAGSVSLTTQVSGVLPLGNTSIIPIGTNTSGSVSLTNLVSGVLPQANMSSTSLTLSINTFGSLSASQVTTSPLSANAQLMTNGSNQLTVGSVNLSTQVTGSVSITRVDGTGLSANAQVSTNGTGQLIVASISLTAQVTGVLPLANTSIIPFGTQTSGSVSLTTQVSGILPQTNLTLTPTFTQATIGSVSITSSAGGAAYTLTWPGAQGAAGSYPSNNGAGGLAWVQPASATTQNVISATANYNIGSTDGFINLSSASFSVFFPTAVGNAGRTFSVLHNGVSLTQVYTFQTTGGQTIGGVAGSSYAFYTQSEAATFYSDGVNWQILNHNSNTGWASLTPSSSQGFGTPTFSLQWRRNSTDLLIRGSFIAGTTTAAEARLGLPTGATSASSLPTLSSCGDFVRSQNSTSHGGKILIEPSVTYVTFTDANPFSGNASVSTNKFNGNVALSTGDTAFILARVPVQGWQS